MLSGPLFRKTFKSQLKMLVIFAAIMAMYMGVEISKIGRASCRERV